MSEQYFHFTLGPVQSFVSQARRTRDFWAGSFLLSWLTARAMHAVLSADGNIIIMPSIKDDDLLARLGKSTGSGPNVGSLPNNFIAEVPDGFDGDIAMRAIEKAWKTLADTVWEADGLAEAGVSPDLWDTQIDNFWDMAWVIADSDDAGVLAQRKNWRSYMPPESLGDKCTMMGEWQELSGADKPNPKRQQFFWDKVRGNIKEGLDLQEGERLCAIAYVKRRFVHVWQSLEGHQGWRLPTSVPSTSYMAAVHWLEDALNKVDEASLEQFHQQARSDGIDYGEWSTDIACIKQAIGSAPLKRRFASLDGRYFFESELDKAENRRLRSAMKALREQVGSPSPFYAVLMMDGDSLGETKEMLAAANKPATALSESLANFTRAVPRLIEEHNGFLIYAGGDDVLAILPLEDALLCAAACRAAYQKAFDGQTATISAAIEYAHMKLPLTMILNDAHKLLDDVAKDGTGRDAVACRVWKPGGQQQTWAMPWEEALDAGSVKIADLAMKLGEDEKGEPGYASKFLYHIRKTLEMLQGGSEIDSAAIRDMLIADYVSSGLLDGKKDKKGKAESLIESLLEQCRVFENKQDTDCFSADGALLLRFLAQKGVER